MKVLITGGAGFIGSHLADFFVRQGCDVTVLDNFSFGKKENLVNCPRVRIVEGDIRNRVDVDLAMAGCELVLHQAAKVSVPYSIEHMAETNDINVNGAINIFESAVQCRARRVIYASSAAVYGDKGQSVNESEPTQPISPYGLQKMVMEQYARFYTMYKQLDTVGLRYFNAFGPRQDPSSPYSGIISLLMHHAANDTSPTIFGDGRQARDFVFVQDVVQANWLAANAGSDVSGEIFNVGRGENVDINTVFQMVNAVSGKKLHALFGVARPGDIRFSQSNIDKARKSLGYQPAIALREGLEITWKALRH